MIETVIGDYEGFVRGLIREALSKGLRLDGYEIDHLGFRVDTVEEYEVIRDRLTPLSSELATTVHNGREFSIFKLKEPLIVDHYEIPVVELPTPSPNKAFPRGLEHAEMVIAPNFKEFCDVNSDRLQFDADMTPPNATAYIVTPGDKKLKFHAITLYEAVGLQGGSFRPL